MHRSNEKAKNTELIEMAAIMNEKYIHLQMRFDLSLLNVVSQRMLISQDQIPKPFKLNSHISINLMHLSTENLNGKLFCRNIMQYEFRSINQNKLFPLNLIFMLNSVIWNLSKYFNAKHFC